MTVLKGPTLTGLGQIHKKDGKYRYSNFSIANRDTNANDF